MFATYPNYNKMEKILEKLSPEGMTICPTESCDPYFVGCGNIKGAIRILFV